MVLRRRRFLGFLAGGAIFAAAGSATAAVTTPVEIKVYKDPACGCCSAWVKHIKANGFAALVEDRSDLNALKRAWSVPDALRSCHTALVNGYVLEGHVPAKEIIRLLAERPDARGLAVPGMPAGSPGMESPGQPAGPYTVMIFNKSGTYKSYASYS